MSENTELTTVADPGALATLAAMMLEDAKDGRENITIDAMAVPFLRMLQAKSPEVENDSDNYRAGMLIHSVTGKKYDIREKGGAPLRFVQAFFAKQIVEWGDKDAGNGGIKGRHPATPANLASLEKAPRNDKNKPVAPNGNILEETAYHSWILVDDMTPAVMPLKSTGLTPSKKLMRTIDSFKNSGPTYAKVYEVTSFLDKQKSGAGNTFMNVRFSLVGDVTDPALYMAAKSFYKALSTGAAVIDDAAEAGTQDQGTGHQSAGDGSGDDNVPF